MASVGAMLSDSERTSAAKASMTGPVAHACIVADYRSLYDLLDPIPMTTGEPRFGRGREGTPCLATFHELTAELARL
jgi:hypothetical protein